MIWEVLLIDESKKKEYFWASKLIVNYQGTMNHPGFQSLDKETRDKALYLFQEQKLISCDKCGGL